MTIVYISPNFQVVIPQSIRGALKRRSGQKIQMIPYGERIELLPARPITSMRDHLNGIDTAVERETDR